MGRYENFPTSIHGIARFSYPNSMQKLQKTILHVLHRLNLETHDLRTLTKASPINCEVKFEFGIADEKTFTFLDEHELRRVQSSLEAQALQILDVFCAAGYHVSDDHGKRTPLKFDYTMLRFAFQDRTMELFVSHERGSRRIPLEDLILFLTGRLNKQLGRKSLALEYMRTL